MNKIKCATQKIYEGLIAPRITFLIGEPFFWILGRRRKKEDLKLTHVKRILVVRLDEIGDVIMTTPFLRELRLNLPKAWITLVVKPSVYNLVELCPYVDEILTYDWNVRRYFTTLRRHGRALKLVYQKFWKRRFDLAILPRWDTDYYNGSFLTYFSGAPWRVAYSENVIETKKDLNKNFDCLFTHVLNDSTLKHEVKHNLDLLNFLGAKIQDEKMEVWINADDERFASSFLEAKFINEANFLIALCPGAGEMKRRWPISLYAEIALWIKEIYGAGFIIIGGPGEEALGEELQRKIGRCAINMTGKTTLRNAAALLKCCSLYIGNDAGPIHMAAALNIPIIEISCHAKMGSPRSPNSPLRFSPWGVTCVIVQPKEPHSPCKNECTANKPHCILNVSTETVKEAIKKLLRRKEGLL